MKAIQVLLLLFCLSFSVYAQIDKNKVLVHTSVMDLKKNGRAGEKVTFTNTQTGKSMSKVSGREGKCFFVLLKGIEYAISYQQFGKKVDYSKITIPKVDRLKEIKVIIKMTTTKKYTLDNVLFATGKAQLKTSSHKALDELVQTMREKSAMVIEIAGHTDNVGNEARNLKLSQERAEAVRQYLIGKKISASRITAKGYGDKQPIADNKTQAGRAQNRRTEVHIVKE